MTAVFWIIVAAMIVASLAWLAYALLHHRPQHDEDREQQNVAIARERLKELEAEFGRGALSETSFQQARKELEQALLIDVEGGPAPATSDTSTAGRGVLWLTFISVPLLSVSLYLYLGTPAAIDWADAVAAAQQPEPGTHTADQASLEKMVATLADKLKQNPQNAEGWYMLGRSYMSLQRYPEAVAAFEHLHKLVGDDPAVLLRYADALAMNQGGRISGKPFVMVKKALEINPNEPTGLWLAGLGHEELGQYEEAVRYWRQLEPMLANDQRSLNEVHKLITRAEQKLGRSVAAAPAVAQAAGAAPQVTAGASITVKVELAPAFKDKVSPDDTVFIFAQAMSGPPMPLAVSRKQVKDLPVEVTLDDSMAMMPQMKLSSFPEVRVGARVSKTGNAMPQSGDLQGVVMPVIVAEGKRVEVSISEALP